MGWQYFLQNPQKKKKQTTTSAWNCCPSGGGRRPSHLLPSPQLMFCQYSWVCSRTSGFNMPLHKMSRCSAGAEKSVGAWSLNLVFTPRWHVRNQGSFDAQQPYLHSCHPGRFFLTWLLRHYGVGMKVDRKLRYSTTHGLIMVYCEYPSLNLRVSLHIKKKNKKSGRTAQYQKLTYILTVGGTVLPPVWPGASGFINYSLFIFWMCIFI